jgi:general secretion pathway protein F
MVRAGEASGALAVIFERLAEFERSRDDLRNYIISSMIYPALLACVGVASIAILLGFVVPRFATIFTGSSMKIPTPTLIMLRGQRHCADLRIGSRWARWSPPSSPGASTRGPARAACGGTGAAETSLIGRRAAQGGNLALRARHVDAGGQHRAAGAIARHRRGHAQQPEHLRRVAGIAQGVKRGEGIAGPMRKAGVFPPLAAHLLTVGEETGRLDQMFTRMADIYENDTRAAIRRFTSVFEPAVILVMGIVVGALILSMLLAITSINDVAV